MLHPLPSNPCQPSAARGLPSLYPAASQVWLWAARGSAHASGHDPFFEPSPCAVENLLHEQGAEVAGHHAVAKAVATATYSMVPTALASINPNENINGLVLRGTRRYRTLLQCSQKNTMNALNAMGDASNGHADCSQPT